MDGIRFLLDGRLVCAEDLPRTMTVLEYLREVRSLLEPQLVDPQGVWIADYVRLRFSAGKA